MVGETTGWAECVSLGDFMMSALLNFRHKKRRPWTSFFVELVEPGSFEHD